MATRSGKRGPIREAKSAQGIIGSVSKTRSWSASRRYKRQAKHAGMLPQGYFANPTAYADKLTDEQKTRLKRMIPSKWKRQNIYGLED